MLTLVYHILSQIDLFILNCSGYSVSEMMNEITLQQLLQSSVGWCYLEK